MNSVPRENRGRRESRVSNAPAASCAKIESTRVSHHRFAGSVRLSPRNGFNGFLRDLPGDRALLPPSLRGLAHHDPVGPETSPQNLTPASGRQDHTTSPSATTSFVCTLRLAHDPKEPPCNHCACRRCRVHRVPPRVRDDREPPLWGRDGAVVLLILASAEAEYFLPWGWTVFSLICPAGGFVDAAGEFYTRHSQRRREASSLR
jgi:hypothetical protein